MFRTMRTAVLTLVAGLVCASSASATETISYTYDARGRLIKVVRQLPANSNAASQACYKYDKADNRTKVTTTVGSTPDCPL